MIDKLIELKEAFMVWFVGAVAIVTTIVMFTVLIGMAMLLTPWPWLALIAYMALV